MSHKDQHFKKFAISLENAIEKYGGVEEITIVERQKNQVEKLVRLEKEFRKDLIRHPWGPGVYRSFMEMIMEERGNILAARPFFRERQDIFILKIAKALRTQIPKKLYPFAINYQFVRFVMNSRNWRGNRVGGQIVKKAEEIMALRTELVEMNMPLAISRARIFWSRTPRSHLSYMDLVQISCEGLMSAVDKFVLPYSKVFRSVAIGRIVGNFIENYSETLVHFYPQDKRKIYRANKSIGRQPVKGLDLVDFDQLAVEVNTDVVEQQQHTNASELSSLLAAASHVSADSPQPNMDMEQWTTSNPIDRYAADSSCQPDVQFEEAQVRKVLRDAYEELSILEKKLLRMKGLELKAIQGVGA
jgi:RNA polymerase sigma factor (sigma-70 family)